MSVKTVRLKSPAKINLWLKILGRRTDGYHELDTLLCPISLYDDIVLEPKCFQGVGITIDNTLQQFVPADKTNLAFKAAELFFPYTGFSGGLNIKITKRIPIGAGLGGGSSNAAAVLYGLNVLYGEPVSLNDLAVLALKLGADVPFFLQKCPARALGIGEKLVPWPNKFNLAAVVIFPGVMASTAKIYQNFKFPLTNVSKHSICLKAQKKAQSQNLGFVLQNDLEQSALALFTEIGAAKSALANVGMNDVLMSGSGSAVFGLCSDMAQAQRFVAELKIKSGWRVFTVDILNKFDIVL